MLGRAAGPAARVEEPTAQGSSASPTRSEDTERAGDIVADLPCEASGLGGCRGHPRGRKWGGLRRDQRTGAHFLRQTSNVLKRASGAYRSRITPVSRLSVSPAGSSNSAVDQTTIESHPS